MPLDPKDQSIEIVSGKSIDIHANCKAHEDALRARVAELEAEVHAWRYRFPDLAYTNKLDGIQPKG